MPLRADWVLGFVTLLNEERKRLRAVSPQTSDDRRTLPPGFLPRRLRHPEPGDGGGHTRRKRTDESGVCDVAGVRRAVGGTPGRPALVCVQRLPPIGAREVENIVNPLWSPFDLQSETERQRSWARGPKSLGDGNGPPPATLTSMTHNSTDARDLNRLAVRIGLPEFSVSPECEDDLEAAALALRRAWFERAHKPADSHSEEPLRRNDGAHARRRHRAFRLRARSRRQHAGRAWCPRPSDAGRLDIVARALPQRTIDPVLPAPPRHLDRRARRPSHPAPCGPLLREQGPR